MAEHNILGKEGESIAREFLKRQGYKILESNWRFEKKEIDLIVRKDNTVVIVEVKTRSTDYYGEPEDSVTKAKQKFLVEAADAYAQQLKFEAELRFDIISIVLTEKESSIKHIEDAFIPLLD